MTIDLLTEKIEPGAFDIERNRILAGMCSHNLKRNIEQLAPPATVTAATLTAEFGIADYCEDDDFPSVGKSIFTVTLVDDRGKAWRCTSIDERILADD